MKKHWIVGALACAALCFGGCKNSGYDNPSGDLAGTSAPGGTGGAGSAGQPGDKGCEQNRDSTRYGGKQMGRVPAQRSGAASTPHRAAGARDSSYKNVNEGAKDQQERQH